MPTSKEYLGKVIDSFRAGNHDDANAAFGGAVEAITQRILHPEEPVVPVVPEVSDVDVNKV